MTQEEINMEMLELQRLNHKFNCFFAIGVTLTIILTIIRLTHALSK